LFFLVDIIIIMEPSDASALYEKLRSESEVDCTGTLLEIDGAVVVSVGLQLNPTLLRLALRGCDIDASDAMVIAEALKVNSTLQMLNLNSNNRMGDSGVAAIAEALKVNSSLRRLWLCGNYIEDSGATAIAEALKVNSSLQKLSLGDNQIYASGAEALAEALELNSTLQQLDLSCNQIWDSGAALIARALLRHPTIHQLDLRYNYVRDAGVAAIEESLERSFLGLEQNLNAHFPEVLLEAEQLTMKYHFLYALSGTGFRSFNMNDVTPALWPHALASVSTYPALIFHLLPQIPWSSNFWCVNDPQGSLLK
jgi:hypothetical protein